MVFTALEKRAFAALFTFISCNESGMAAFYT